MNSSWKKMLWVVGLTTVPLFSFFACSGEVGVEDSALTEEDNSGSSGEGDVESVEEDPTEEPVEGEPAQTEGDPVVEGDPVQGEVETTTEAETIAVESTIQMRLVVDTPDASNDGEATTLSIYKGAPLSVSVSLVDASAQIAQASNEAKTVQADYYKAQAVQGAITQEESDALCKTLEPYYAIPTTTYDLGSSTYDQVFQLVAKKDDTEVPLAWKGFLGPAGSTFTLNGSDGAFLMFGIDSATLQSLQAGAWQFQVRFQPANGELVQSEWYPMTLTDENYQASTDAQSVYLAVFYESAGDFDTAIALINQGLAAKSTSTLYAMRARILEEGQGDLAGALADYEAAYTLYYDENGGAPYETPVRLVRAIDRLRILLTL